MEEKTAILASLLCHIVILSTLSLPQPESFRADSTSADSRGVLTIDPRVTQDTTIKARTQEGQDRERKKSTAQPRPDWMWPRSSAAMPFVQSPAQFELTFDVLDSLSRLHPELKEALLREAIIAGALRDDSIYCAWHDNYLRALSGLRLPGELEGEMRLNQRRFGTTYDPMRGPLAPHQIDAIKLIRSLVNLYQAVFGK